MIRPCYCISSRTAALLAGIVNLIVGMTGLSVIVLNPADRHMILDPLEKLEMKTVPYDAVGDTLQLLIEYLLPALGIFTLGLVLVIAATTMNPCMTVFSFLLSTMLMTGCISSLVSLTLSGVDLLGAVPLMLIVSLQMYVYWIVIDFNKFSWEVPTKDDKKVLVDSEV